jgi:hypothetical protein
MGHGHFRKNDERNGRREWSLCFYRDTSERWHGTSASI